MLRGRHRKPKGYRTPARGARRRRDRVFTDDRLPDAGGFPQSSGYFVDECRARGFHVIETGDQLVVLCHEGSMVIHC